MALAFFPAFIFWALDGFYLWQERLFRAHYDYVRNLDEEQIDFSMKIDQAISAQTTWVKAVFADITVLFHVSILVAISIVLIVF